MAKVNSVALCPQCEVETVRSPEGRCPNCRYIVDSKKNPVFEGGYYLTIQKADAVGKAKQIKSEKERNEEFQKIEQAHKDWAVGCSDEDRLAAMQDALHLLRYVVHSPSDPRVIKSMTSFGKQIGDLSQAIENYIAKSGAIRESIEPAKPIDRAESSETP